MENMKKFREFDYCNKEEVNEKLSKSIKKGYDWMNKLFKSTVDFTDKFWKGVKRESRETKVAITILRKMMRGEDVSESEKKFFKKQVGDIIKIFPLIAIQGLPGGSIAITPLLISLGKKYNFNPFPSKNDDIITDNDEGLDGVKIKND